MPPPGTASMRQKSWDTQVVNATFNRLIKSAPDKSSQVHLWAALTRVGGLGECSTPLSHWALGGWRDHLGRMGFHFGIPLCLPHVCQLCYSEVYSLRIHGLRCHRSQGRHHWHVSISGLIQRHLSAARIPAQMKPRGMLFKWQAPP